MTFGLRDATLAALAPEDVYARYCAWEMAHRDPRFDRMDATVAKRMLAELNPGFAR